MQSDSENILGINDNFLVFRDFVARAEGLLNKKKYNRAARYAKLAAVYAYHNPAGLFVSHRLEQVLLGIGNVISEHDSRRPGNVLPAEAPKQILHVLTQAYNVGGHTRLVWRWIERDKERSHSVVLTSQSVIKVPGPLKEAVARSGGRIYQFDKKPGGMIAQAKRLREIAASADQVVLHIHPYDVIPIIAFADGQSSPPIIFMNHADHAFWLGAGISSLVADFRDSGSLLSRERRGIESRRCFTLPIPLLPQDRTLTRAEAKKQLGLAEDAVVLLSVSSAYKFKARNKVPFVEVHVPLLNKYEKAVLLAVGPEEEGDWVKGNRDTGGRIRALGPHKDISTFYQAADVYVVSFPFGALTSLLEAGSYGIPLIGYRTHAKDAQVLRPDDPALTDCPINITDLEQYKAELSRLIEDRAFRARLGESTKERILSLHTGEGWDCLLRDLYRRAAIAPSAPRPLARSDQRFTDELASSVRDYFKRSEISFWLDGSRLPYVRRLPLGLRTLVWAGSITLNRLRALGQILRTLEIKRRLFG